MTGMKIDEAFAVTFTYQGEFRDIAVKNPEDVLKLADVYIRLLTESGIEFTDSKDSHGGGNEN